MAMLISVIIPTHNQAHKLKKCLASLSKQNYPHNKFEIIIIDDKSNDETKKILGEYTQKQKNIQVIKNKENKGSYFSRNVGVKYSKGIFVAFTDSDCIIPKNWLLKIEKKFRKEIDVLQGSWEIKGKWELPIPKGQILSHPVYRIRNGLNTRNLVLRKEIALKNPFNEKLRTGGDKELGIRLAQKNIIIDYDPDVSVIHFDDRNFMQTINKGRIWGRDFIMLYRKAGWKALNPKLKYPLFLLIHYYILGFFYQLAIYKSIHGAISSAIINIQAIIYFKTHYQNLPKTKRERGLDFI